MNLRAAGETDEMGDRDARLRSFSGWVLRYWKVLACLSWFVSGALYLTVPPSADQFNHAYLGWRLLEGDIPYRDFIDVNWPGVMALHALAVWIFGVNIWSWHALDFLLFAASALFLADLLRLAAGREAARLGLILLPVMYPIAGDWVSGQHDMSAAQFLVAALWFHVRGYARRSCWWQLGTGLFIGAAMLNKPTVGVIGLLLPMQALWLRTSVASVLAHTVIAGAAAVMTLLVALVAVLSRGTTLSEIVEVVYTYNLATQYNSTKSLADLIVPLGVYLFRRWSMFTLASIPAAVWMLVRANRSMAGTSLHVLWLAGIVSFFLQWQGYGYHLAPCLVALNGAAVASLALIATGRVSFGGVAWRRTFAAGFVLLVFLGIGYKLTLFRSLPVALLARDYERYLAHFRGDYAGKLTVADVVRFVRRLDALPPTDCVFVVGEMTAINYLSRRRQPTRFYYFPVLDDMHSSLPQLERWVALWERDLRAANCRYALVTAWTIREFRGPHGVAEALREFLKSYRKTGVLGTEGGTAIYERQ